MGIPQDRLSSSLVSDQYLETDDRERKGYLDDYEDGPIALEDTSEGIKYQPWHLTVKDAKFVLTPEDFGNPVELLANIDAIQCSLAFDQNGHVNIIWIDSDDVGHLYWYDTTVGEWLITDFTNVQSAMMCMDDKRLMEIGVNDILVFFTREQPDGSYNLYHIKQRDRYDTQYLMEEGCAPFIRKLGMHRGLRVQISLTFHR